MKRYLIAIGGAIAVAALLGASSASAASSAPFRGRWQSFERDAEGKVRINVLYREDREPRVFVRGRLAARFLGRVRQVLERLPGMTLQVNEWELETTLAELAADPDVLAAEPDYEVRALGQSYPWGVRRVDADISHADGFKGGGVKVAVLDSGVWRDSSTGEVHPDLKARYKGGWDFVNNDGGPWDDFGHGTHVAGTLAATSNTIGVVGVAPRVRLYALKVLDRTGSGKYSDIAAALDWSIRKGMDVVNMSLGGIANSAYVEDACIRARAAGITLVAAAGNAPSFGLLYPARYLSVISVSNTTSSNVINSGSSYGAGLDFAAPGTNIRSTVLGGGYASAGWTGTSMASPHVAGAAALLIGRGISDPDILQGYLAGTATDLGAPGLDNFYGHGLVKTAGSLAEELTLHSPAPYDPLNVEIIPAGSNYSVDWDEVAGARNYRVVRSCNGGPWIEIASGVTVPDVSWQVPVFLKANRSCRLQVAAFGPEKVLLALQEAGPFTVAQVVIDAPLSGAVLTAGEEQLVAWSLYGTKRTPARIRVFYSRTRGRTWKRIATLPPDATSLLWTVPGEKGYRGDRRLRVVVYDAANKQIAVNTVKFAVTPAP